MIRMRFTILILALLLSTSAVLNAQTLPIAEWRLASYNFREKIAFPIDKAKVTLHINEGGKLGGRSGCNIYGGAYSFDKEKLKISGLISTMMACDPSTMRFERLFSTTLENASEFSLKGDMLTITDPKTKNFVRFVKAQPSRHV